MRQAWNRPCRTLWAPVTAWKPEGKLTRPIAFESKIYPAMALTWLWRDYDPPKTSQNFEQEESEKKKPLWRVVTLNRE
jgi:hypothetical protein